MTAYLKICDMKAHFLKTILYNQFVLIFKLQNKHFKSTARI